jgi:2-iminobutanoate/2-iminopropanoate deaminase
MKRIIQTDKAAQPLGPYSQAIVCDNRVYLAGQGGIRPKTGEIPTDFNEQATLTMENIKALITEAGGTMADIVKVVVYLKSMDYFNAFNEVYKTYFDGVYPVRTAVTSDLLKGTLVEVDVIAELGH